MLPNPGNRTSSLLAAAAIAVILIAQIAAMWPFTVDDAYITLRYARHWAEGLGPVYQTGGAPAEGYTTFLWMTLLTLPHLLRLDALLVAKLLGVLATLALVAGTGAWASRVAADDAARAEVADGGRSTRGAGLVAALALACLPATAVHAVSGMETALFALLLLVLVARCGAAAAGDTRGLPWLAALSLALGLTRPEGNLLAAVALGLTCLVMPRAERGRLVRWTLLGYVLPGAAYFLWRWSYYGAPLPLPYYLKLGDQHGLPGAPRVLGFLGTMALPVGAVVALALVRPPRRLWPALAGVAVLLAFYVFPAHIMGYYARYLFPAAPILCAAAGVGAVRLVRLLATRAPALAPRAPAIGYGLAALLALTSLSGATRAALDRRYYGACLERAHVVLGERLARLPHGTLAISDAGATPYLSDWRTIDLLGLNDRHIALHGADDPRYVLDQHPDVVVIASREPDRMSARGWDPWGTRLFAACANQGYRVVTTLTFSPGYYLLVMARPDDPRAAALADSSAPLSAR